MTGSQLIKMALVYRNITEAELARRLKISPQLLNSRFKADKFTIKDMENIADVLECEFEYNIRFKDGYIIKGKGE